MNANSIYPMRTIRRIGPASMALAAVWFMALAQPLAVQAQMQIPNPLLQPPRLKSGAAAGLPPAPGANENAGQPAKPVSLDSFNGANGALGSAPDNTLREVRERFGNFYVSAIMGRHAVLRSNAKGNPILLASANSLGSTSAPPSPMPSAAGGRSETFLLSDSEPLEFVGEAVTLVPRITANRVYIYYVDSAKKTADKSQRHPIVFIGEVESSEALPAVAPILEKPDAAYRQSISTQSKSTSSVNSSSSQPSPSSPSSPPSFPPLN